MRSLSISFAALFTMATTASATTLASGTMFGGSSQNTATCYLFNAGDAAVNVTARQIIQETGGALSLTSNNCTGALAAGSTCVIVASIVGTKGYACKFVVSPDGALVRGEFELRAGATVLNHQALR